MNLSRRSLLKAFAALTAGPTITKLLPAKTGLEAWLPTAESQFFGIERNTSLVSILKTLWPQERIEALVYSDSPLVNMVLGPVKK